MTRAAQRFFLAQLCACLATCVSDSRQDVAYSSSGKTLGDWPAERRSAEASTPAEPTMLPPQESQDAGPRDAGHDSATSEDDGGEMPGTTEPPDKPDPKPAADGGSGAAGSGGGGNGDKGARLSFSVLTEIQHPRKKLADPDFDDDARGPKNMGAIWIEKDGTFVRSLEVWRRHKERSRHLLAYNEACKCPTPDVVTSGTLEKHKAHMVTWDMTDRKGAKVDEGEYTLHIEVADYDVDNEDKADPDAKNAVLSIPFDTKTAPRDVPSEASEFYSDVKLELLAP